jgi:hypothetical protein
MTFSGGGWVSNLGESLKKSVANRAALVKRFGFVPLSMLKLSRGGLHSRMFLYQRENPGRTSNGRSMMRRATQRSSDAAAKQTDRLRLGLLGGLGLVHLESGRASASTMPAELVEFFAKYYTRPGQVYLDPFMGQGVQMQVAKLLGLHYYGYDVSEEFFRYIDAVRVKIDDGRTEIKTTLGDSRRPDAIPDGVGDFSFHSPPYWDTEFYGDEPGQLGNGCGYEDFLAGMEDVARAWLPKFKAGATHVVNVNDFRKGGRFYAYHADTITLFRRAGWELIDTWIIEGLVGGLPKAFAVDFNLKRIAPKVHEYALVFRKP